MRAAPLRVFCSVGTSVWDQVSLQYAQALKESLLHYKIILYPGMNLEGTGWQDHVDALVGECKPRAQLAIGLCRWDVIQDKGADEIIRKEPGIWLDGIPNHAIIAPRPRPLRPDEVEALNTRWTVWAPLEDYVEDLQKAGVHVAGVMSPNTKALQSLLVP